AADLVSMARPVTKWATRIVSPSSVLRVLRRAIKIASTPPMGPVFVALPMDVLDAPLEEDVVRTPVLSRRVAPEAEEVAAIAAILAGADPALTLMGAGTATPRPQHA